jgi:hypothetical protein
VLRSIAQTLFTLDKRVTPLYEIFRFPELGFAFIPLNASAIVFISAIECISYCFYFRDRVGTLLRWLIVEGPVKRFACLTLLFLSDICFICIPTFAAMEFTANRTLWSRLLCSTIAIVGFTSIWFALAGFLALLCSLTALLPFLGKAINKFKPFQVVQEVVEVKVIRIDVGLHHLQGPIGFLCEVDDVT